jgi:hypothetical protein
VLFWIGGGVQVPGSAFGTRQCLWGNIDFDAGTGWGIFLTPSASQIALTAALYAAGGPLSSGLTLSVATRSSFVERLICAGLWYDGENLSLSINGSLMPVGTNGGGADPYIASARAATLGANPVASEPATNARILSAGYAPALLTNDDIGAAAGNHFSQCREAYGGAYLAAPNLDWAHRYEVSAGVPAGTSGTITKTAAGAVVTATPVAPAALADVGNLGPQAFPGTAPVALNRVGALNLRLAQIANPDWYDSAGFAFTAPG